MSSGPPPDDEPPAEPKPKKKRKKAPPIAVEAVAQPPKSEALVRLIAAFDAGNYALVRQEAPRIVELAEDLSERDAAQDLLRRIDPDPISKWMMGGAGLLLAFLAAWYWSHVSGRP